MRKENKLLFEILKGREERAFFIKKLNEENNETVICLTINSPGPDKLSENYKIAFREGVLALEDTFNAKALNKFERLSGYEAYFLIDKSPEDIKKLTVEIEENHPLGRLFDIDIFYKDLLKISREEIGMKKRKCLICDKLAVECGRSRAHSVEELECCINSIVSDFKERGI